MPQYLRDDSIRLLEASQESLGLAIFGLYMPYRHEPRHASVKRVPVMGLAGCAAELAMTACLTQVYGSNATLKTLNHFKSGREILSEFRSLLRSPVPRASFLTAGVASPAKHREELLSVTSGFTVIISNRAAALHNGIGPNRDVCIAAIDGILRFLRCLGASKRIHPYLQACPDLPQHPTRVTVLLADLVRSLRASESLQEQALVLSNIFLVLPEFPEDPPTWLDAFDRIHVLPTQADVALLLQVLEHALPADLRRTTRAGAGLATRVEQTNPVALPIAPYRLRRSLTNLADRWDAQVGLSNGAIDQGRLDLPPPQFVLDLFVGGRDEILATLDREVLPAHEIWAFVASSLLAPGTPWPYWFLVRMCSDYGQLRALLKNITAFDTRAHVPARLVEGDKCIAAIATGRAVQASTLVGFSSGYLDEAENRRERLKAKAERPAKHELILTPELVELVISASRGESRVSNAIDGVLGDTTGWSSPKSQSYWARVLCEAAVEIEDRAALVEVMQRSQLSQAHTAARKSLRLIDVATFGPNIQEDERRVVDT